MLKRKSNPVDLPPQVYCSGGVYFFRHPSGWCQRLGSDAQGARALAAEIVEALPVDPDAIDDAPVVHRIVPAVSCRPLKLRTPASVFDLPERPLPTILRAAAAPEPQPRRFRAAVATGGVVKVEGSQYPDSRWTPEREEQEIARRARQRPPRPTWRAKRFKMRGSISSFALKDVDGDG